MIRKIIKALWILLAVVVLAIVVIFVSISKGWIGYMPPVEELENPNYKFATEIFSEDGKVQTLTSRMGTGGNNVPLLLKIRSGCEGGGKGPLIQEDKSATLSCNNDQTLFEPCAWDGSKIAPTLTANNAGGSQRMPDKDNFNCIL